MQVLDERYTCALALLNTILGGKWKLRILWHIHHGDTRFSMLKRGIAGISEKVLSEQLRELEAHGLITRTVVSQVPPHVIYGISSQWPQLIPLISTACDFSREYARVHHIELEK